MTTYVNDTKVSSTYANDFSTGNIFYIMTDTPDYVLVGASEDEFLVWQVPTVWVNQSKT